MQPDIPAFADTIITELQALGDPIRAEGETRYFKGTINSIGTGLPALQKLEKSLCKGLEKSWSIGDAMALCDTLLEHRILEVTLFALTFIERFAVQITEAELARFENWLESDLLDNWAAVDTLCPHALGTAVGIHPEFVGRIKTWPDSANPWVRRASAVTFILLARRGEFLDDVYEISEALLADKTHDLVQKGNGWVLREAGKVDPDRLEKFLLKHGPQIPRTTVRYAIEKFAKDKRDELLALTKSTRRT